MASLKLEFGKALKKAMADPHVVMVILASKGNKLWERAHILETLFAKMYVRNASSTVNICIRKDYNKQRAAGAWDGSEDKRDDSSDIARRLT